MVNIDSYKKGVHWPVSLNCIAGSGVQLIEVTCFSKVFRWPIIGFQLVTGSEGGGGWYSGFQVTGMMESVAKIKTPKKSHAEFPSSKNFQKVLNET